MSNSLLLVAEFGSIEKTAVTILSVMGAFFAGAVLTHGQRRQARITLMHGDADGVARFGDDHHPRRRMLDLHALGVLADSRMLLPKECQ